MPPNVEAQDDSKTADRRTMKRIRRTLLLCSTAITHNMLVLHSFMIKLPKNQTRCVRPSYIYQFVPLCPQLTAWTMEWTALLHSLPLNGNMTMDAELPALSSLTYSTVLQHPNTPLLSSTTKNLGILHCTQLHPILYQLNPPLYSPQHPTAIQHHQKLGKPSLHPIASNIVPPKPTPKVRTSTPLWHSVPYLRKHENTCVLLSILTLTPPPK